MREENVVPLALPKLPSAFESSAALQIVPNGLVRQDRNQAQGTNNNNNTTKEEEPKSSVEEEKLLIDSTITEKKKKKLSPLVEESFCRTSDSITMKSINTSWSIAGESMAHESDFTMKTEENKIENKFPEVLQLFSEDATLNNSTSIVTDLDNEVTLNDVQFEVLDEDRPFVSQAQKFAVNEPMLEDETSPSISFNSNSKEESREEKKDPVDEQLEDTSEPAEVKSPTHTSNSNSNSISEPGRDFLIDDEIADQPGLFSNFKNGKLVTHYLGN